jgi:hypothetical protein
MSKGSDVTLQGLALASLGMLFLLGGLALSVFRTISKGQREWMGIFAGQRGRVAAEAVTPGTWSAVGVLFGLLGLGLLFAGLNLFLRQ